VTNGTRYTKSVPLTNSTRVALVSEEDYGKVIQHEWRLMNHGYVATGAVENRPTKTARNDFMLLHRFVLGLPQGRKPVVDHINRDKLDCRRENLHVGTQAENLQNCGDDTKGIYAQPNGTYRAMIRHNGELLHIGLFDTQEEAIQARKDKESELGWRRIPGTLAPKYREATDVRE